MNTDKDTLDVENSDTKTIKVLDHGFVRLLDHMGDDSTICQRARMSTDLDKAVKTTEDDAKLIDYLWRMAHCSPFEFVEFAFEMKLPVFVARQLIRHRTASVSEVSARYTELPEEFYIPEDFHLAATSVKQGRSDNIYQYSEYVKKDYRKVIGDAFNEYHKAIAGGVSKEEARIILPLATYTRWAWKMDLNNLLKTLTLRCDNHAQYEIRVYADAILELIRPIVPAAVRAWERHSRDSIKLTPEEKEYVKTLLNQKDESEEYLGSREARIFRDKLGI